MKILNKLSFPLIMVIALLLVFMYFQAPSASSQGSSHRYELSGSGDSYAWIIDTWTGTVYQLEKPIGQDAKIKKMASLP